MREIITTSAETGEILIETLVGLNKLGFILECVDTDGILREIARPFLDYLAKFENITTNEFLRCSEETSFKLIYEIVIDGEFTTNDTAYLEALLRKYKYRVDTKYVNGELKEYEND